MIDYLKYASMTDYFKIAHGIVQLIWTILLYMLLWWLTYSKQTKERFMKLSEKLKDITQQAVETKNGSHKLQNAIRVMEQEAKYGNKFATFYGPTPLSPEDIEYLKKEGCTVEENKAAQITVVRWLG
jgi:hypothetical protein